MKKLAYLCVALLGVALFGCSNDDEPAFGGGNEDGPAMPEDKEVVVSFEDLLTEPETSLFPEGGATDGYYTKILFQDSGSLMEMPHWYNADKSFGGGFTYTNTTDTETAGYANISAITGKGKLGKVYLTVNSNDFTPASVTNMNPEKYRFKGAWVTNTTYAYLAVKDGNDGGLGVVRKFEDRDYFVLTAIGYDAEHNEIDRVEFYLADYRNGQRKVVDTWEWFDWSVLSSASYITFEMDSSDRGYYGMNTPSYFCLDGITLAEK